jgi:hypothetical protein
MNILKNLEVNSHQDQEIFFGDEIVLIQQGG